MKWGVHLEHPQRERRHEKPGFFKYRGRQKRPARKKPGFLLYDLTTPPECDIHHDRYPIERRRRMLTARVFRNGRSQAVRLPKECRVRGKDVYVHKLEGVLLLVPKGDPWAALVRSLGRFSEDFMAERRQPWTQTRKSLP
jgi:antitoxin VapB